MVDLNYIGHLLRPYCNEEMCIASRKIGKYGNSFPPLSMFLSIIIWMKCFPQDLSIFNNIVAKESRFITCIWQKIVIFFVLFL